MGKGQKKEKAKGHKAQRGCVWYEVSVVVLMFWAVRERMELVQDVHQLQQVNHCVSWASTAHLGPTAGRPVERHGTKE